MIPNFNDDLEEILSEESELPYRTYRLNIEQGRILGFVDDEEAVLQAVAKILSTERYAYTIYPNDYGFESVDLIGQDFDYVLADLPRRIEEALTVDDRIQGIEDFNYTIKGRELHVTFSVLTIYSNFEYEMEVAL